MSTEWTQVPSLKQKLNAQITELSVQLPLALKDESITDILLVGSCARGEASYRSDIDLFIVLGSGILNFSRVQELRDLVEKSISETVLQNPLPVQIHFILKNSLQTSEPALKDALKKSISLLKDRAA